ncbi:hypothetical protein SAMN05216257_102439 [Meinhardsimonia xiamenensis]|uniref:Dihydroorotate dehydrogenase n=2 Tax=Meinhardsimonia xiamenensis TaxID=990712 RepID=A0A1G9B7R1_9RHOB|nr:hypothetical protein LV81_01680 [Meinhardsimonia xiamenensis]SDK35586.1 hypothetical protein SAMN05216257_102439 [Meinhardsimonia xiamenensis]
MRMSDGNRRNGREAGSSIGGSSGRAPGRALGEAELELFFEAARSQAPEPPSRLMARILADAEGALAAPAAARATRRRPSLPALVGRVLGGWPALAGLSAAAVAGLAIGLGAPETVEGVAVAVLSDGGEAAAGWTLETLADGWAGYGSLWEEG